MQPPSVAFFTGETGVEESHGKFSGQFHPDDPGAKAEHIHVIVLYSLVG